MNEKQIIETGSIVKLKSLYNELCQKKTKVIATGPLQDNSAKRIQTTDWMQWMISACPTQSPS